MANKKVEGDFNPEAYIRKKYQAAEAAQKAFDPAAYIARKSAGPAKGPSSASSALQGFGQSATLGYLPHLQAAVSQMLPDPNADVNAQLAEQGFTINEARPDYVEARDARIKRDEELQKANPMAYGGGALAGAAVQAGATMGLPVPTGANAFSRIAQSAATGAALSAAANPGDVEGELSPLQLGKRYDNAMMGAAMGGAIGTAGEGLAKGYNAIKSGAKKISEMSALKSAGAMTGDLKKMFGKNRISPIAQKALNETVEVVDDLGNAKLERLVEAGDDLEKVNNKVAQLRSEKGKELNKIYEEAESMANRAASENTLGTEEAGLLFRTQFKPSEIASEASSKIKDMFKGKAGGTAAAQKVESVLGDLTSLGDEAGILQMQDFKRSLDDVINYDKSLNDLPIAQKALKALRDDIDGRIKGRVDALDKVVGGDRLARLKSANETYGAVAELDRVGKQSLARQAAHQSTFGLYDRMAGGGGMAIGALTGDSPEERLKNAAIGAGAGLVGNKLARTLGPSTTARFFDWMSKKGMGPGMAETAIQFQRANPSVLPQVASNLMNDPKLEQPVEPAPEEIEFELRSLGKFPTWDKIDTLRLPSHMRNALKQKAMDDIEHNVRGDFIKVTPEMQPEIRNAVIISDHLDTIEKAKIINTMTKKGEIPAGPVRKMISGGKVTTPPISFYERAQPVDRKPVSSGEKLQQVTDMIRAKRKEEF